MRSGVMLMVLGGVLVVGACGGREEGASETSLQSEQVEIRTSVVVAATPGAEPIATGEVVAGSTLGGSRVLRWRDHPGHPRKPRSRGGVDRPDDHLPGGQKPMDMTPEVSQVMP